jgi:hypothetical protein
MIIILLCNIAVINVLELNTGDDFRLSIQD